MRLQYENNVFTPRLIASVFRNHNIGLTTYRNVRVAHFPPISFKPPAKNIQPTRLYFIWPSAPLDPIGGNPINYVRTTKDARAKRLGLSPIRPHLINPPQQHQNEFNQFASSSKVIQHIAETCGCGETINNQTCLCVMNFDASKINMRRYLNRKPIELIKCDLNVVVAQVLVIN